MTLCVLHCFHLFLSLIISFDLKLDSTVLFFFYKAAFVGLERLNLRIYSVSVLKWLKWMITISYSFTTLTIFWHINIVILGRQHIAILISEWCNLAIIGIDISWIRQTEITGSIMLYI